MSKLDEVRALFPTGAVVECVENTLIPVRNGTLRTITRAGRTVSDAEMDGKAYRMELPKRVGDVLAVNDTSCTYRLPGRPEHTVTMRRVQA